VAPLAAAGLINQWLLRLRLFSLVSYHVRLWLTRVFRLSRLCMVFHVLSVEPLEVVQAYAPGKILAGGDVLFSIVLDDFRSRHINVADQAPVAVQSEIIGSLGAVNVGAAGGSWISFCRSSPRSAGFLPISQLPVITGFRFFFVIDIPRAGFPHAVGSILAHQGCSIDEAFLFWVI
jgi:hypothetical protein